MFCPRDSQAHGLYRWLILLALVIGAAAGCQPILQPAAPAPQRTDQSLAQPDSGSPPLSTENLTAGAEAWALTACQSCHGALAEGDRGPALRGTALSRADFLAAVRNGSQGMRPYSAAEFPDSRAGQMHMWLQTLPSAPPTPIPNAYGLVVPPGVAVSRVAVGLQHPAGLALGPDGALYVALHRSAATDGQVWRLADADGDGEAEQHTVIAAGLALPTALLWLQPPDAPAVLLIGGKNGLYAWTADESTARPVLTALPGVAEFAINDLALGIDGFVYLAQGPAWWSASSALPQPGAIWRLPAVDLLAQNVVVAPERFASGMRSPFGLAFSPSGAIYSVDSSIGWPPHPVAPEELNLLLGGGDYGGPTVWGQPMAGNSAIGPMVEFPAGVGASDLLFYSGRLLSEHANDLIMTYSGQPGAPAPAHNDIAPRLVRMEIVSDSTGYHSYIHEFISGLQRPLGLAENAAGALYVADYDTGAIYRFSR
jgi:glucose/arabinose dehydrogenase